MTTRAALWILAASYFVSAPVAAQSTSVPDTSRARLQIGPLKLSPTIELTNFGVDTNVFNEPGGQEKRDLTLTLSPKVDAWMKVGPTWITGAAREDILWYRTYSSERTANNTLSIAWAVPLNRLAFGVSATSLRTRDRPGFEIDTRAKRGAHEFKGLVEYRAFAKTFFGVRGARQTVDFDDDAVYLDANLRVALNRTASSAALLIRHQLTPLTSLIFDVGQSQDRFAFSPLRDSESRTAGIQVSFDPFALIKGSARIGYISFNPADPNLPGYDGSTAAVDLTYTLLGATRFSVSGARDIQFSFDLSQPYYLQTAFNAALAQQIYGPVDAVARVGLAHLNYRDRAGSTVVVGGRQDSVQTYGGGIGYHIGRELRIGVNIDRQRRITDVIRRRYNDLRIGMSVTYGM